MSFSEFKKELKQIIRFR